MQFFISIDLLAVHEHLELAASCLLQGVKGILEGLVGEIYSEIGFKRYCIIQMNYCLHHERAGCL